MSCSLHAPLLQNHKSQRTSSLLSACGEVRDQYQCDLWSRLLSNKPLLNYL